MSKSALVVIDVQKIYTQPDAKLEVEGAAEVVARINQLIKHYEKQGAPILYVRHMHKADGSDSGRMWDFAGEAEEIGFVEGSEEVEDDPLLYISPKGHFFTKTRYSCFSSAEFRRFLEENKIDTLTICGFMTNFCCESTAREAHDRDYFVDFIIDATGTPDLEISQAEIKRATAQTLSNGFARVLTTQEALKRDNHSDFCN
jgi:nicotinamidase-related amidase